MNEFRSFSLSPLQNRSCDDPAVQLSFQFLQSNVLATVLFVAMHEKGVVVNANMDHIEILDAGTYSRMRRG